MPQADLAACTILGVPVAQRAADIVASITGKMSGRADFPEGIEALCKLLETLRAPRLELLENIIGTGISEKKRFGSEARW